MSAMEQDDGTIRRAGFRVPSPVKEVRSVPAFERMFAWPAPRRVVENAGCSCVHVNRNIQHARSFLGQNHVQISRSNLADRNAAQAARVPNIDLIDVS